jgi:hypothetical protein
MNQADGKSSGMTWPADHKGFGGVGTAFIVYFPILHECQKRTHGSTGFNLDHDARRPTCNAGTSIPQTIASVPKRKFALMELN